MLSPETLEEIKMMITTSEENRNWFLGLGSLSPANRLVYPPAPEQDENDYQDETDQIEEFCCS